MSTKSIVDDVSDIAWRLSELERERKVRQLQDGEPERGPDPQLWAPCPKCNRRVRQDEDEGSFYCDHCDEGFQPEQVYIVGAAKPLKPPGPMPMGAKRRF